MNNTAKGFVYYLLSLFFSFLFVFRSKVAAGRSLYIFDIDNTVGNTFPTLQRESNTERERLVSIEMFPRMKYLIKDLQKSPSRKVIFVTARSYKAWGITQKWFLKNEVPVSLLDIIIVSTLAEKVKLLTKILPAHKPVTFVDDMSWNHEKGEVKFYENEIQLISKLKLRYIGFKTIARFTQKIKF